MELLKALPGLRARTPTADPGTAPVPETGSGVRATWRFTIGSIVFYDVFLAILTTLFMLEADGLQPVDIVIIVLAVMSVVTLVRYCWFFKRGVGGGLPELKYTLWLLLPAAALWFLGLLQSHTLWVAALPVWFAANAVAVVVRRPARWWVFAAGFAALVLHGMVGLLLGNAVAVDDVARLISVGIWALLTPLVFVSSIWWWEIVMRLDHSRRTSGELAVAKERLRFAADLHDIQGHHLQVIALKTELAARLLDTDPDGARSQIEEVQHLARTALEDTRALVHGYRTVSLADEAANAAEVLRAAGIGCSVEMDADQLPSEERTLFGLVIRESTTNILRHSEATSVTLRLERSGAEAVLNVTNDGVRGGAEPRPGGSGIDGLRRRFEAVGGAIAARREDGCFVLTATAPRLPRVLDDSTGVATAADAGVPAASRGTEPAAPAGPSVVAAGSRKDHR